MRAALDQAVARIAADIAKDGWDALVAQVSNNTIYINAGTHVRSFTRITGPCYIGRDVNVVGGDISGCSIGDVSKVRGELSSTIVLGHSNKGHDGFVGRFGKVTVHKIDVAAAGNSSKEGAGWPREFNLVPADLRNLQAVPF